MISDSGKSVMIMFSELLLNARTLCLEKKPLQSPLSSSIESLSGDAEGNGGQQMMPDLLNKTIRQNP